jgi:hypothetical protein
MKGKGKLKLVLGPLSVTGSDWTGTGATVLVVVIVLVWMAAVRPPFAF